MPEIERKDTMPPNMPSHPVRQIPILCYHRVHRDDDPATPPVTPGKYCGHVTCSVFRRHTAMLADRGFTVVTHQAIVTWLYGEEELPPGPVACIDFDDNRLNVLENAFPVMKEYGFRGTVFVVSRLAAGDLPDMQLYPWMNWEHLGRLMDAGWTIGAHTASHRMLAQLYKGANGLDGPKRVHEELVNCNEAIERELGIRPNHFAYPSGDRSEEVEALVARHYRTARDWFGDDQLKWNTCATHPYRLAGVNVSMNMTDAMFSRLLDVATCENSERRFRCSTS